MKIGQLMAKPNPVLIKIVGSSILILQLLFFTTPVWADTLRVAVAANLSEPIKKISRLFEKKYHHPVSLIIASSGKITAQIQNGAPFDIFLAANKEYPNFLYKNNLALGKPRVYTIGSLVLWSARKNIKLSRPVKDNLLSKKIKRIALPNPRNAPYGKQAINYLTNSKIISKIRSKLIYGESVSQTNQFIYSQSVEVGITAKSTVFSPKMKNLGHWLDLDSSLYDPIEQAMVILKHSEKGNKKVAIKFYNFILSPIIQNLLQEYGYNQIPATQKP